jgi:hypothetical protein
MNSMIIDIVTADGVTNGSTMTESTLSEVLYLPEDGTKGSADVMFHSIKE